MEVTNTQSDGCVENMENYTVIIFMAIFIYYSDLMQKIDNTTTLLNRRCYDSFTSKLNGQLDKLRADDEHIPTVSVGYTEYEPSESFIDAFARADDTNHQ